MPLISSTTNSDRYFYDFYGLRLLDLIKMEVAEDLFGFIFGFGLRRAKIEFYVINISSVSKIIP